MRLVSQDGMLDVPYESSNISLNYNCQNKIIAWRFGCDDSEIADMATYSTKEKALKVMEMLRQAYIGLPIVMQNVDVDEKVIEKLKTTNTILANIQNQPSKIEYLNNGVFKFPLDEDVV